MRPEPVSFRIDRAVMPLPAAAGGVAGAGLGNGLPGGVDAAVPAQLRRRLADRLLEKGDRLAGEAEDREAPGALHVHVPGVQPRRPGGLRRVGRACGGNLAGSVEHAERVGLRGRRGRGRALRRRLPPRAASPPASRAAASARSTAATGSRMSPASWLFRASV